MIRIPQPFAPFFWEINREHFDAAAHPEYTIARILEYGDSPAVAWLREAFSEMEIPKGHPRDIARRQISAIVGRGTKRDFVDLYAVSQRYGLPRLRECFQEKFAKANYSTVHLLKSLTYFDDAEKDPMPDMRVTLSGEEVKQFFTREVPRWL